MLFSRNDAGEYKLNCNRDSYYELPDEIMEKFDELVEIESEKEGVILFKVLDYDKMLELLEKNAKRQKNKYAFENREISLLFGSSGTYRESDIKEIYEAQNGLCYYSREPLNNIYEIDHIVPVSKGGSSWPKNIALASKIHNRLKSDLSKAKYLLLLDRQFGSEWLADQKEFMRKVDKIRNKIDKRRRLAVSFEIEKINKQLQSEFEGKYVEYEYSEKLGSIVLYIEGFEVNFPPGFIRQRRKPFYLPYLKKIARALID